MTYISHLSLFKKSFFLYILITIVSFSVLAVGLTLTYKAYFYDLTRYLLVSQATKIAEVYEISFDKDGTFDRIEFVHKIQVLDRYMDYKFILVDKDKKVIWSSDNMFYYPTKGKTLDVKGIDSVLDGKTEFFSGSIDGIFDGDVYTVGYPIKVGDEVSCAVFVNSPLEAMISTLHSAYLVIFVLTLTTLCIAFMLIYYSTKRIVSPIKQMNEAAKIIAGGNYDKRIEVCGGDEIAQLAESFNYMAETLDVKSQKRRDFMLNLSHDFRSPLTSILGFLQAIIDGTVPKEKINYYLHIIYSETERLSKLTNNILDIDIIDSGQEKLEISSFDIVQLMTDTLMNFEERINNKKIKVDFSFSSGEIYVDADKEKIERVIYNLFDNAIKFLLDGGNLSAKVTAQNDRAEITISDTGIGMTEEEQKRAFERFYKADSSRGKDKKGSGLGLSIVQGLLKVHGETITMESEKYEGTTFKFSLPISKNE